MEGYQVQDQGQRQPCCFDAFSQRYERGSILVTTNLPLNERTEVFGSERLTGALLDRLTHHVHILEMNGESYRLKHSRENLSPPAPVHLEKVATARKTDRKRGRKMMERVEYDE